LGRIRPNFYVSMPRFSENIKAAGDIRIEVGTFASQLFDHSSG
jgi:hypothetical protein